MRGRHLPAASLTSFMVNAPSPGFRCVMNTCGMPCIFCSSSASICGHRCREELAKMEAMPQVYITHLKPGEGALTMKEVSEAAGRWRPRMLENNQEFSL